MICHHVILRAICSTVSSHIASLWTWKPSHSHHHDTLPSHKASTPKQKISLCMANFRQSGSEAYNSGRNEWFIKYCAALPSIVGTAQPCQWFFVHMGSIIDCRRHESHDSGVLPPYSTTLIDYMALNTQMTYKCVSSGVTKSDLTLYPLRHLAALSVAFLDGQLPRSRSRQDGWMYVTSYASVP
jgi:hypothetical protein